MKMKNGMLFLLVALLVFCSFIMVGAEGHLSITDIQEYPTHIEVGDKIQFEDEELVVTDIGKGCFIATPVSKNVMTISNCRHSQFVDVGKPMLGYRRYSKTKHEIHNVQKMMCRLCHKYYAFRYYNIRYGKHYFAKNKTCIACRYRKK